MFEDRIEALNKAREEGQQIYTPPVVEKRTYTVDEIQDILGICRTSVYNLVNSGAFRCVLFSKLKKTSYGILFHMYCFSN